MPECPVCNKSFAKQKSVDNHVRYVHQNKQDKFIPEVAEIKMVGHGMGDMPVRAPSRAPTHAPAHNAPAPVHAPANLHGSSRIYNMLRKKG